MPAKKKAAAPPALAAAPATPTPPRRNPRIAELEQEVRDLKTKLACTEEVATQRSRRLTALMADAAAARNAPTGQPGHYVLVMRDASFCLIGPFTRAYDAARWAKSKKNNPTDDPRWQTIRLTSPRSAPLVQSPQTGPMPA